MASIRAGLRKGFTNVGDLPKVMKQIYNTWNSISKELSCFRIVTVLICSIKTMTCSQGNTYQKESEFLRECLYEIYLQNWSNQEFIPDFLQSTTSALARVSAI
jgi:hypothetical protein